MHVYQRLPRVPVIIILLLLVIIPLDAEAAEISSGDVLTVEAAEIIYAALYCINLPDPYFYRVLPGGYYF